MELDRGRHYRFVIMTINILMAKSQESYCDCKLALRWYASQSRIDACLPSIFTQTFTAHLAQHLICSSDRSEAVIFEAGADVKEDLKNWAKQQEAELAEEQDSVDRIRKALEEARR